MPLPFPSTVPIVRGRRWPRRVDELQGRRAAPVTEWAVSGPTVGGDSGEGPN
jgi:hypothetical protein